LGHLRDRAPELRRRHATIEKDLRRKKKKKRRRGKGRPEFLTALWQSQRPWKLVARPKDRPIGRKKKKTAPFPYRSHSQPGEQPSSMKRGGGKRRECRGLSQDRFDPLFPQKGEGKGKVARKMNIQVDRLSPPIVTA